MKHQEMSLQTKQKLSEALKVRMRTHPFSKITITQLLEDCDITRPTFYYHFKDLNDLVMWMMKQEVFSLFHLGTDCPTFESGMICLTTYIYKNKQLFRNLSGCFSQREFEVVFFSAAKEMALHFIKLLCGNIPAKEDDIDFIADFFTHAVVTAYLSWIEKDYPSTPEELSSRFEMVLGGNFNRALERSAGLVIA